MKTDILNQFTKAELRALVELRGVTTRGHSFIRLRDCNKHGVPHGHAYAARRAGFVDVVFTLVDDDEWRPSRRRRA